MADIIIISVYFAYNMYFFAKYKEVINLSTILYETILYCSNLYSCYQRYRSSHPEVFIAKGVLKICGNFTGEDSCRCEISIKLQSNVIEMALRHACSPLNLLHIFRTPFLKNASGRLLLKIYYLCWYTGCHQNYPSKDNLNKDIWNITSYIFVNESEIFTLYLYKFCVTVFK